MTENPDSLSPSPVDAASVLETNQQDKPRGSVLFEAGFIGLFAGLLGLAFGLLGPFIYETLTVDPTAVSRGVHLVFLVLCIFTSPIGAIVGFVAGIIGGRIAHGSHKEHSAGLYGMIIGGVAGTMTGLLPWGVSWLFNLMRNPNIPPSP